VILFCGIPSEGPLALAIAAAERLGLAHVVFNQRDSRAAAFTLECNGRTTTGSLLLRGRYLPLSGVTGIYARLLHPVQVPEHRSQTARTEDADGFSRAMASFNLLEQWLQIAPSRVANRPNAMLSNASKPYQAQLIARCGFAVPATLVTNSRVALDEFNSCHKRLIYKSVSAQRSIVQELAGRDRDRLRHLHALPTQFQARVPGVDIRVHVVGSTVFATRIETGAVDYRYARRDGHEATLSAMDLPTDVAERCVRLARSLQLPFCGIDLRQTPDGELCCFEVNPSPAYSYYEETTGQPISETLVKWLAGAEA
jgi:glutathione synthase/RimK-type ligase-like ATP-grasp enzyme